MKSRDEIVKENIGLVHSCAQRFKGRGIEYDDLFQAGCIGLIKAVDAFDSSKGAKLSTYAVPGILGEIKRLFRDGGSIKIGRSIKELSVKVSRECTKFSQKEGRTPTVTELSNILKVEEEKIIQALEASIKPMSLTVNNDDKDNQLDIPIDAPDEKISEIIALKQIINELQSKDRSLIILRFFKNMTQTKTAQVLGMTQVQVSRREKVILDQLRKKLA